MFDFVVLNETSNYTSTPEFTCLIVIHIVFTDSHRKQKEKIHLYGIIVNFLANSLLSSKKKQQKSTQVHQMESRRVSVKGFIVGTLGVAGEELTATGIFRTKQCSNSP